MPKLILVTGGTGNLGSRVVRRLGERDVRVRVLSRRPHPAGEGVEYVAGDLAEGTGLDEAVAGADVIVHCASAPRGDAEAAQHLVRAALAMETKPHLVYISVVGVDGVGFGYFRSKLAAERIVVNSGLPWSVLRATQFYDYILNGTRSMTRLPVVPVPKDFRCQAIDVEEVADRLVEVALGPPSGRVPDLGGPEVSTWADMVRDYLRLTHRRRLVLAIPMPGTRAIRDGGLLVAGQPTGNGGAAGRLTWTGFLARRFGNG
ncbi:MAG TPA: NAD(P)H-binding protein [Terriglobales bacterium]|nr:NAD(P)H-binding protein [Terriglobales bacterium]